MNTVDGQTILTICVSALIFFSLGGLAGWLLSLLRSPSHQAAKSKIPGSTKLSTAQRPVENSSKPNHVELARIYQNREDGQVSLEANGRSLSTPADIRPTERTWLVLTAETIYRLLGQDSSRVEPPQPPQPAAAALPPIEWQPTPPQNFQKPSMNPADVLIRAMQAGQPKLDQAKSLVEQIDEVLQELLAASPLQVGEIHLSENEALGLEVRVGSQSYDGIQAVPDEHVRQVLRAAIAEWQRRSRRT